ncbi:MAG TPA: hypothetical protein VN673_08380 [Clostridia bacterium]|nr:hypothetical protein [Clostridia bacterium]
MTPEAARAEFDIRYYRWALQDFKREIDEGFPFLKGFKTGSPAEVLAMMSSRTRSEQLTLASALVKRFHKNAVETAGDRMTGEEEAVCKEYLDRVPRTHPVEVDMLRRAAASERGVYANRGRLVRLVKAELKTAGMQVFESEDLAGVLSYQNTVDGWQIITRIHTRERHAQLAYNHTIDSMNKPVLVTWAKGTWREGQQDMCPVQLHNWISLVGWLGISSRTQWSDLVDSDGPQVANELAALCKHFLHAAPTLLAGLSV